jgi:hypothetical protein
MLQSINIRPDKGYAFPEEFAEGLKGKITIQDSQLYP